MNMKTAQTIVAVADGYYGNHIDYADRIYTNFGEAFGGFPAIWNYVAEFAVALDELLAESWDSEGRPYIEDTQDAAYFLAKHLDEHGFDTLAEDLAKRFTNK